MKKLLAMGLLSVAVAQAGVFVGVQGGYDVAAGNAGDSRTNAPLYDGRTNNSGWSAGANVGYELDLGYVGARAYLQFDYSRMNDVKYFSNYDIDLNVDGLFNFVNSDAFGMGLYAGLGIGYQLMVIENPIDSIFGTNLGNINVSNIPLFARVGLTFKILSFNRIDIGVKLPIVGWNIDGPNLGVYSPLKAQISYKIVF